MWQRVDINHVLRIAVNNWKDISKILGYDHFLWGLKEDTKLLLMRR